MHPLRTLSWVVRHRFYSRRHLRAAVRFVVAKIRHPEVDFRGFVFIGKGVQLSVRPGYGRLIIGAWTHLADHVKLRAHEGTIRVGEKCILGYDLTVNAYLDVEIGDATIIGDRVYICDFDHRTEDITTLIKDQGLTKSPVRIGADCWLGTGVTILRGTDLGRGSAVAAHGVVRGIIPPWSICAGVPVRVVANRAERYADQAGLRSHLTRLQEEAENAVARLRAGDQTAGEGVLGYERTPRSSA